MSKFTNFFKNINKTSGLFANFGFVLASFILNLVLIFVTTYLFSTATYFKEINQNVANEAIAFNSKNSTLQTSINKNEVQNTEKVLENTSKTFDLPEKIYFTGLIQTDSKNNIEIPISAVLDYKDGKISGVYIYDSKPEPIKIDGKIERKSDKNIIANLVEQNLNGENTGLFTLDFTIEPNGSIYSFNSTWQKDSSSPKLNLFIDISEEEIVLPEFNKNFNALKISTKISKIETNKYLIDYKYPEISGMQDQNIQNKINKIFSDYANAYKTKDDFEKYYLEQEPTYKCSFGDDMRFEVYLNQNGLLSIEISGYYFTCGAHGSHTIKTFNIDLKTGDLLSLKDIFSPNIDYINRLDPKVRQNLFKEYSQEDIDPEVEGLKPSVDNYKNWVLTKDGLEIHFEDYQVGAYALGNPIVVIPYGELKDILRPEFMRN